MKVCCVFSLESNHRGDSNKYTQHTIINIKRNSPLIILNIAFFQGTQEQVRNSRGKRAISGRATEDQLYYSSFVKNGYLKYAILNRWVELIDFCINYVTVCLNLIKRYL